NRLTTRTVEGGDEALFRDLRNGLAPAAVDRYVDQIRSRRWVIVPQTVVHELVVPDALPGLSVEADERLREEVGAESVAAVIVRRSCVERNVHITELLVGAVRRPSTDFARVRPGVALPRVIAELTRPRDRMEDPFQLSSPGVPPAAPPGNLFLLDVVRRDGRRRDDRVADDNRRRLDVICQYVQPVTRSAHGGRQS